MSKRIKINFKSSNKDKYTIIDPNKISKSRSNISDAMKKIDFSVLKTVVNNKYKLRN
jgi:hypothetical protein